MSAVAKLAPAATDPIWEAIVLLQKAQEDLDGARATADDQHDDAAAGEAGNTELYVEMLTWIRTIKRKVESAQRLVEQGAAARKGAAK